MSTGEARGEAREGFRRGGELEWPSDSQGSHSRVTKMGWAKVKPPTHVWRERRLCEAAAGVAAERATVERGNVRRTAHPDVGHQALDAVADAEAERVRVDELARAVPQQVVPLGDHVDLRRRQKVLIRHLSEYAR